MCCNTMQGSSFFPSFSRCAGVLGLKSVWTKGKSLWSMPKRIETKVTQEPSSARRNPGNCVGLVNMSFPNKF